MSGSAGPAAVSPADLTDGGLEGCIDAVLDAIGGLPGLDGAGCLLLDDHASLRYVSASDAAALGIELAEELTAEGPCADAFLSSQPVMVEDLHGDERYRRTAALLLATPIRSVLALPVVAKGRLVGSVDGYASAPRRWEQVDLDRMRPYVEQVGRLVEDALDSRVDDLLTAQIAGGLEHAGTVDVAVDSFAARQGITRVEAARQLRQVAAALGPGVARVSRHILETGQLPDPNPLLPLTDYRFSSVVQHLKATAIAVFDADLRYLLVAGEATSRGEWARNRLEERTLGETVPAEQAAWMEPLFRQALDGAVAELADYHSPLDGRWYRMQVAPVNDREERPPQAC